MRAKRRSTKTLRDRFNEKFIPVTESGCWIWIASSRTDGYGQIGLDKKKLAAHRVAWELYRGPIHDGLHVCHHCDVHLCVNPDHLFLGTRSDNMQDCERKGRSSIASNRPGGIAKAAEIKRAQTHCKRGHLLSGDNVYRGGDGSRRHCRECHREYSREYMRERYRKEH